MHSFIQEEAAREHHRALINATQRAAESARYRRGLRKPSRLRKTVGVLMVRVGLRMTWGREAFLVDEREPDPSCC